MAFKLPAGGGGGTGGGVTQSDLDAHAADSTNVHAIVDTSQLVVTTDTRLSDKRTANPDSVGTLEINSSLKPSGAAVAATEALRALGTTSSTAAAGDHTHAALTADQAAGTASVRTLGTGAQQAAVGSHTHSAAAITNVPALEVTSTNAQAAINEVAAKTVPQIIPVTASTATTTIDLQNFRTRYYRVTLNANTTFAFTNVPANVYSEWQVEVAQDATGGRTIAWPAMRWDGDTVPAPLTAASSVTIYTIWSRGGTPFCAAQVLKSTGAV
jgi:hypothetical protein